MHLSLSLCLFFFFGWVAGPAELPPPFPLLVLFIPLQSGWLTYGHSHSAGCGRGGKCVSIPPSGLKAATYLAGMLVPTSPLLLGYRTVIASLLVVMLDFACLPTYLHREFELAAANPCRGPGGKLSFWTLLPAIQFYREQAGGLPS